MKHLPRVILKSYQAIFRLILPNTCRFYPSCSDYSLQAIDKYGVMIGIQKTFKRVIRCSPFSRGGFDPLD